VRGFVYEAAGTVPVEVLAGGVEIVRGVTSRNSIPLGVLEADPSREEEWLLDVGATIGALLG